MLCVSCDSLISPLCPVTCWRLGKRDGRRQIGAVSGAARGSLALMEYAVVGTPSSEGLARFVELVETALERDGFTRAAEPGSASLVVNVVDLAKPRPFRRRSRGTFVVALFEREEHGLVADYPILVRALANIVL